MWSVCGISLGVSVCPRRAGPLDGIYRSSTDMAEFRKMTRYILGTNRIFNEYPSCNLMSIGGLFRPYMVYFV